MLPFYDTGAYFAVNGSRLLRGLMHPDGLSVEARLERHELIRVEGGRVRRALQKAGAVLDYVRNNDQLERRLGFSEPVRQPAVS